MYIHNNFCNQHFCHELLTCTEYKSTLLTPFKLPSSHSYYTHHYYYLIRTVGIKSNIHTCGPRG